jgi:hypothetical protein
MSVSGWLTPNRPQKCYRDGRRRGSIPIAGHISAASLRILASIVIPHYYSYAKIAIGMLATGNAPPYAIICDVVAVLQDLIERFVTSETRKATSGNSQKHSRLELIDVSAPAAFI